MRNMIIYIQNTVKKVPNIATARITWEVVFINMMIVAGYEDISTRKEVQKFAKKNMGKIWNCEYISKVRKIQLSLFAGSFPVYVLFTIYIKRNILLLEEVMTDLWWYTYL